MFWMKTSTGGVQDPIAERPDIKWWDVLGMSTVRQLKLFFKFNLQTH